MNYVVRLMAGDFGLARTYWLFGVGGSLLMGVFIGAVQPEPGGALARALVLTAAVFLVPVLIGIWRAAGVYKGKRAWKLGARAAVGLSVALFYAPLLFTLVFN